MGPRVLTRVLLPLLFLAVVASGSSQSARVRTALSHATAVSDTTSHPQDDVYLQHVNNFYSLIEQSAKQHSLAFKQDGLEGQVDDPEGLNTYDKKPLPSEVSYRTSDPYEKSFKLFMSLWKVRDIALGAKEMLTWPFQALKKLFKKKKQTVTTKWTKEQLLTHAKENCAVTWQPQGKGRWADMEFTGKELEDALRVDQLGVYARACVPKKLQQQFLFAEYQFVMVDGHYTGEVEPNDDVPLMAKAARLGALAYEKARREFPDVRKPSLISVMMEETRDAVRKMFPWAAAYIEDQCKWEFNTAGNGIAQICYLYGSIAENIVFWGSPIGNRGFSGSYDSKVWDHMLTGTMKTFEAGHTTGFVQRPGQFHLLERWSGNYYTIDDDCYMLDYVQGNMAQSMKFALVVPTQYYTLDYRSTMRTICQYASLVLKNAARQGKFAFGTLYAIWKKLIKPNANEEHLTTADCLLLDGLPEVRPKFKVGSTLQDSEFRDFSLSESSTSKLSKLEQPELTDDIDDDSLNGANNIALNKWAQMHKLFKERGSKKTEVNAEALDHKLKEKMEFESGAPPPYNTLLDPN